MPKKTYNVRTPAELRRAYQRIAKGIAGPFKSTRRMFMMLGAQIDRDTQLTIKGEGSYKGRQRWIDFGKGEGVSYYLNKNGTYQHRYGTDGSKTRRYSPASKLLQASGQFRQSFRILKVGQRNMLYGTRHRLAEKIMSEPDRPIIQYTPNDKRRYTKTIMNWWKRGIKF